MVRKKYTHNTKSLRRYKKNELKKFVKDNDLPLKINTKMTKNEIVSSLLKLQRSGYSKCFCKLELKKPRKMSQKQQENIKKLQERNRERLLKMKDVVKEEQKIDKKKEPEPLPIKVNEKPTEFEKIVKQQPLMIEGQGMNLDNLFDMANNMDDKTLNENLEYFEREIFGEDEEELKQDDIDFFERELLDQEEEKKEEPENPLIRDLKTKTNRELIQFMKSQNIPNISKYKNKTQRINIIIEKVSSSIISDFVNNDDIV